MSQNQPEQAIREQAAEWVVLESAGPLAPLQQQALARWCAADPRHAEAYAFARRTWDDLGALGATSDRLARRAAPQAVRAGVRRSSRWRRALVGAAALLVVALGVEQAPRMLLDWRADYATAAGEVRQVTLPDGSRVVLDSRSAIELVFEGEQRRVRLLAGEAVFEAAPVSAQEPRPFVVEYGGATVRALGTRFVVGQAGEGGWVGMFEHRVALDLRVPPAQGRAGRILEQGDVVRYDQASGIQAWTGQDLRRATDWERGVLVFERQPLAQVVERLNRYRDGRLVVLDRALGEREVSGVFRIDGLAGAGAVLGAELGARVMALGGVSVIY